MQQQLNSRLQELMHEQRGFTLPEVGGSSGGDGREPPVANRSTLSHEAAIEFAQLVELADGSGSLLYHPRLVPLETGELLFLRERTGEEYERGVIVQIIGRGTAKYPAAESKALFRLLTNVRAQELQRSHNEPAETIDEFLVAKIKVRAAVRPDSPRWEPPAGATVTRNVDIFRLDPKRVTSELLESVPGHDVHLGDYVGEPVAVFGGGFEKVNLITGMKGAGKSHIAKGIIKESLAAGMSTVVFDINGEYAQALPGQSIRLRPTENMKFRLDRHPSYTATSLAARLAPFAERTRYEVEAALPPQIEAYLRAHRAAKQTNKATPMELDLAWIRDQATAVIPGTANFEENMRASFRASIDTLARYKLIASRQEVAAEESWWSGSGRRPPVITPASAFYNITKNKPTAVVLEIGGLRREIQEAVIDLVLDYLKELCNRQHAAHQSAGAQGKSYVPIYPTVFFEEAHMYMDAEKLNDLIPVIRHIGLNVFFVTNSPGALPDSVFRLLDNLVMTRMVNTRDIAQVQQSGLADDESIEGFAHDLKDRHALLLSGRDGITKNFPLVAKIQGFGLPQTGVTRSMWAALRARAMGPGGGSDGTFGVPGAKTTESPDPLDSVAFDGEPEETL